MSPLDPLPDDLDDALTPRPGRSSDNAQLREALLSQTIGVIRRRRRWKQIRIVTALAACYVAGMATLPLWRAAESRNLTTSHPTVRPADDHAVAPSQIAATNLSPYELLRQKGDRELDQEGDVAAAARTYRRALQMASSDQRRLSVDHDSWLLATLKTDASQNMQEQTQ